jgi:hypothetical protein
MPRSTARFPAQDVVFRVVDINFLTNENLLDDSVQYLFLLLCVFTILLLQGV